jgi:hypothetical protein
MEDRRSSRGTLALTISAFSFLFGVSGIEHGVFEILQGSARPEGLLISAIGPGQRFWSRGIETAFTLIPNYLITGIAAVIFSSAVAIWSAFFMKRKGAWIALLFLSIAQFLTGGGFAQISLAILVSLAASAIGRPRRLWRAYVPLAARKLIAAPWIFFFAAFLAAFAAAIEMAVFGFPFGSSNPDLTYGIMMISSYVIMATFVLALLSAFARDSLVEDGA